MAKYMVDEKAKKEAAALLLAPQAAIAVAAKHPADHAAEQEKARKFIVDMTRYMADEKVKKEAAD